MKFEKKILQYILYDLKPKIDKVNLRIKQNTKYTSKKNTKIDPTTKYDIKIEKIIKKEIEKKFFSHEIEGEESKYEKKRSKFKWIIDPIDGTKALLAGMPTWSNLIGFLINSIPKIGFANFPLLKKYYFSDGKNTFVFFNNKKQKIFSRKNSNLKKTFLVINSINAIKNFKILKFFKKYSFLFKITGVDAYNYCLLAEGKIDIIVEAGLKPCDILPLVPIIRNAGGIITNWQGDFDISKGEVIVASNKILHKKFLAKFKKFT